MEKCSFDKNILKPLEDQLQCHVCSEFYNNCVMTVCSHNFCSVCIKKRLTTDDDCPNCFETIRESDLRSNKLLDKLVRLYKKLKLKREISNDNTGRPSEGFDQNKSHTQTNSNIQVVSVQSSVDKTTDSPSYSTAQSGLTDLRNQIPLEDQLRCHICSEFYNNCVMAICSHNFCSVCIKKRLTTDNDCPNCFEIIWESDLRSNKQLDKLVRLYKKLKREISNNNTGRPSEGFDQNNSHTRTNYNIQAVSVQSSAEITTDSPSCSTSQNSLLIHSLQSGLTDLTHPIKFEIIESEMNDVVVSTNSVEDSNDSYEATMALPSNLGTNVERSRNKKRKRAKRTVQEESSDEEIQMELSAYPVEGSSNNEEANLQQNSVNHSDIETLQQDVSDPKFVQKMLLRNHKLLVEMSSLVKQLERKINVLLPQEKPEESHEEIIPKLLNWLPLGSNDLESFMQNLSSNQSLRKYTKQILLGCSGGKECKGFVASCLKRLIKDEVAMNFSLTGKWKIDENDQIEKQAFEKTEFYTLIRESCFTVFKDAKDSDIRAAISDWLLQAKHRKFRRDRNSNKREQAPP